MGKSLKVYNLGGDDLDVENRLAECDWVVYLYHCGGYDGKGIIAWKKDGKYDYQHISHCSCYGPMDDVEEGYASLSAEQLVGELKPISKTDFDYEHSLAVYNKVMELTREDRMGRE